MSARKLYSYATVHIGSHGYMVRANSDFSYEGFKDPRTPWLELRVHGGPFNPNNPSCVIDEVDTLIYDRRNPAGGHFIMVYRSGPSQAEVMARLAPQVKAKLGEFLSAYRELVANAEKLIAAPFGENVFSKDQPCVAGEVTK